jgi:hypothetical protein
MIAIAAVVFSGNSTDHRYACALQQNSTNYDCGTVGMHQTGLCNQLSYSYQDVFEEHSNSDFLHCVTTVGKGTRSGPDLGAVDNSCTRQYLCNGVLADQHLVHDFILYDTGSAR